MTAAKKPDPRTPLVAEIITTPAPSSVRDAFNKAGLGYELEGVWVWTAKALRERAVDELQQIRRIIARSTHVEPGAA